MDFKDQFKAVAERVSKVKENLKNEEATKMALIVPFIQALGYDVFDPTEVEPEVVCDVFKNGEKVDYAIHNNGEQSILIECKDWRENLDKHGSQLRRYYNVSKAKFGILTNGIEYRFYTDLNDTNVLDEKPFLQFTITEVTDAIVEEVKKFHKSYYNKNEVFNNASDLKYSTAIKKVINAHLTEPSADFVKLILNDVYEGVKSQRVIDKFTPLVKSSTQQYINDLLNERLAIAINNTVAEVRAQEAKKYAIPTASNAERVSDDERVVTTQEEIEGLMVVKAICRQVITVDRVAYRDALGYFAILLDDNNRKPIARLYFNTANKYLAFFDKERNEVKVPISSIDDIYNYSTQLVDCIERYEAEA